MYSLREEYHELSGLCRLNVSHQIPVRPFRPLLSSEITNFAMYLSRHVAVAYFFSELGILIRKYSLDRQKRHILLDR